MQVVAEAATGAVQRWIQLNDEATARIMKREEHIEWLRKLFAGWKEARPALRESRRRRDNGGNVQTGQQPVGRTRAATAAQAGGSGDSGQRAKWVRLMMLLRLRERFSCWAGSGWCSREKESTHRRKKTRDTETSADESRADPGTGEPEQTASAAEGTLGRGTTRGGRRPQPTMEDPSPDDAGQTTVRRSRRAGRDEGGSRMLRRSAGGCTKRLGAAGTRGTMWKTASASPPSGGRPRLVADHTHKEPCTKTAGRGPVPFYPSPSRGVRFIYLFTC